MAVRPPPDRCVRPSTSGRATPGTTASGALTHGTPAPGTPAPGTLASGSGSTVFGATLSRRYRVRSASSVFCLLLVLAFVSAFVQPAFVQSMSPSPGTP